jgi:hypothetical protein
MKHLAALSIVMMMQHAAFADVPPAFARVNPGVALGLAFPRTPTGGTLYTGHLPVAHVSDTTSLGVSLGVDVDEQRAGVGLDLDSYHGHERGYSVDAQVVTPAAGGTVADGTTSFEPPAGLEVVLSIGFCMR